jgi:hypothetical protein
MSLSSLDYVAKVFTKNGMICGSFHGHPQRGFTTLSAMAAKYYTHFLTGGAKPKAAPDSSEWSGVVELRSPLEQGGGTRELKALLAQSFDLDSEDIKILHWARLH